MKVLALIILALGSSSALASGPYLPSGWRPDGPAFYLPTKQTPAEDPLKDLILQGSEASGSDALREYGPPNFLVSQDLIKQGLPDEVIDNTFTNEQQSDARNTVDENIEAQDGPVTEVQATTLEAEVPIEIVEINTESQTTINPIDFENTDDVTQATLYYNVQESSDSSQDSDVSASQNESQDVNVLTQAESKDESNNLSALKVEVEQTVEKELENIAKSAEEVVQNVEEDVKNIEENVQNVQNIEQEIQNVEQDVEQKVQNVEQIVQNIPDILTYVDNEITQQVEVSSGQDDVSSYRGPSGSLEQAPEGFLEYGPPGFKEYGPPKVDELAGGSIQELISEAESFQNTNDARRRRFSPKFRPAKTH